MFLKPIETRNFYYRLSMTNTDTDEASTSVEKLLDNRTQEELNNFDFSEIIDTEDPGEIDREMDDFDQDDGLDQINENDSNQIAE